jgi:hypothetical protein
MQRSKSSTLFDFTPSDRAIRGLSWHVTIRSFTAKTPARLQHEQM